MLFLPWLNHQIDQIPIVNLCNVGQFAKVVNKALLGNTFTCKDQGNYLLKM